jgi:hypothetical protein
MADQAAITSDVLQKLPADVVEKLQLDLPELQTHVPDADSFGDVSVV